MVRANVVGLLPQPHELREQLLAFRNIGVVDLVVPDIVPVVRQLSQPSAGIDPNPG